LKVTNWLPRVALAFAVALMALSPLVGMASASIQPDVHANMKAYYSHNSQEPLNAPPSDSSSTSSRSVIKYFDLTVSLGWDGTLQDFNNWQNEITGTNAKLYDGTDGQMAFRQVDIYNNREKWNQVNLHINGGQGRAYTFRYGIYYPGQAFIEEYDQSDLGAGGKVLQHEFGHYGLGLPDEYTDQHGPFCSCTQGTTYNTNEWCCQNTHCVYDPTFCHANGEAKSCWEQIVENYPQLTVKNPPVAGPYDAPTPKFVWHFPDLFTTNNDLGILPATPKTGDTVTISVNVYNKDSLLRSNVDVAFHDNQGGNDVLLGTKNTYISNYVTPVTYSWTATPGIHTISAIIDPNTAVKEITKSNNSASITFDVDAPPVISANLKELHTKEDQPLIVNLTKYGSDKETAATSPLMKWTVSERDSKVITKVYGESSANHTLTLMTPLYWHGKTTVQLTLTDSVGLTAKKNVDLYWDFVNHNPWVDGIMLSNNSIYRTDQTMVTISSKDIEDQISAMTPQLQYKRSTDTVWMELKASLNGDAFTAVLATQTIFVTGNYDLRAMVTDSGSLTSDWSYRNMSLEVKNNPPVVQQVAFGEDVSNGIYRTKPVTLLITATDKEDLVETLEPLIEVAPCGSDNWDKVVATPDLQGDAWAITYVLPKDARTDVTYCFAAYVVDADNDTSARVISDELHILNNPSVVSSIEMGAKDVLRTKGVVLTVKGGDIEDQPRDLTAEITYKLGSGNDEAAYISELAFQPGGSDNNGTWTARFTPTKSAKLGEYQFSARLKDKEGKYGEWFTRADIKINVKNNEPTAVIVPVKELTAGTAGSFDSTGSKDTEDTGLTYTWDFGDHGTSYGIKPTHTYANAGKYTVTLTVKDSDGGKGTVTTVVNVKAANIFTGGGTGGGGLSALNIGITIGIIALVILAIIARVLIKRKIRKVLSGEKAQPQAPPPSYPANQTAPTQPVAPTYRVEAYKVYDTDAPEIGQKEYGEQEMHRAYK